MSARIKEIKERLGKITKGPWKWGACEKMVHVSTYDDKQRLISDIFCWDCSHFRKTKRGKQNLINAKFIAAAPDDIEYLLAEVKKYQNSKITVLDPPLTIPDFYDPNAAEKEAEVTIGSLKLNSLRESLTTAEADLKVCIEALEEYTCDKFHSPNGGVYWKFFGDRFKASKALADIRGKDA